MEKYCLFAIAILVILALVFVLYTDTTNKIIKMQEKEIGKLKTENMRLRSALRGAKDVEMLECNGELLKNPVAVIKKIEERSC